MSLYSYFDIYHEIFRITGLFFLCPLLNTKSSPAAAATPSSTPSPAAAITIQASQAARPSLHSVQQTVRLDPSLHGVQQTIRLLPLSSKRRLTPNGQACMGLTSIITGSGLELRSKIRTCSVHATVARSGVKNPIVQWNLRCCILCHGATTSEALCNT